MRLLSIVSIAFVLGACAAESADDSGDVGDSQAFTSSADTASCKLSRDQILTAAKTAGRKKAITRGLAWFDKKVPYSQSKSFEGYRTDCSGFVSMCWELDSSLTTANLISNNSSSNLLGSYDELLPGDALVRRVGGEGHTMLFLGWNDTKKASACVVEQRSTKLGMQFHVRTSSELKSDSYKPIRATKLANDADGAAGAGGGDDDDDTTTAPNAAPGNSGSADDADQCFLQCIQPSTAANKYVQCSMKCQNQSCDDSCFKQFCGTSTSACDSALKKCDQQCGTAPPN